MTDELDTLYATFTDSVFRLETLQVYDVAHYDERLRVFTEERRLLPPPPPKQEWLDDIRRLRASGRRVHRVHVLDQPLTPYLVYELAVYAENVSAGEDVRIADRAVHPDLALLRDDFILFDGDTDHPVVVWVRYSPAGTPLGWEVSREPGDSARCRANRDLALRHCVPLEEFAAGTREA